MWRSERVYWGIMGTGIRTTGRYDFCTGHMHVSLKKKHFHAVSRTQQGRQKLVLRLLEALRVECAELTAAHIYTHLNKYYISSSGDRTHNQSRLQTHFVPL